MLPGLLQGFQGISSSSKLLIAGSNGFEGDAVVAAVALKMHAEACSCFHAVTQLLHRNSAPLVRLQISLVR